MKKHVKIFALVLALSLMLLTGCSFNKTYSTVEEWYNDNPVFSTIINTAISANADGEEISMLIVDNTIVYSLVLEEKVFGENAELDALYKQEFDKALEEDKDTYIDLIPDIADLSGVPESSISVRIELFNPNEVTPSYTKTFVQE